MPLNLMLKAKAHVDVHQRIYLLLSFHKKKEKITSQNV